MKGICACGKEKSIRPHKLKNEDGTMRPYVCKECSIKKVSGKLKGKAHDMSIQRALVQAAEKYKKNKGVMINDK